MCSSDLIPVKKARLESVSAKSDAKYKLVFLDYADGIPSAILALIRQHCSKDIAKFVEGGVTTYFIAPFDNKDKADRLMQTLTDEGVEGLSVELVK